MPGFRAKGSKVTWWRALHYGTDGGKFFRDDHLKTERAIPVIALDLVRQNHGANGRVFCRSPKPPSL
jgi:hypothetical protein